MRRLFVFAVVAAVLLSATAAMAFSPRSREEASGAAIGGASIGLEIWICIDLPLLPPILHCPTPEPPEPEPPSPPHTPEPPSPPSPSPEPSPPAPSPSPTPAPSPTPSESPSPSAPTPPAPASPVASEPSPVAPQPDPTTPAESPPPEPGPLPAPLSVDDPVPAAETDSSESDKSKRRMMAVMLAFAVTIGAGAVIGKKS